MQHPFWCLLAWWAASASLCRLYAALEVPAASPKQKASPSGLQGNASNAKLSIATAASRSQQQRFNVSRRNVIASRHRG